MDGWMTGCNFLWLANQLMQHTLYFIKKKLTDEPNKKPGAYSRHNCSWYMATSFDWATSWCNAVCISSKFDVSPYLAFRDASDGPKICAEFTKHEYHNILMLLYSFNSSVFSKNLMTWNVLCSLKEDPISWVISNSNWIIICYKKISNLKIHWACWDCWQVTALTPTQKVL